jgi:hypothetical protein
MIENPPMESLIYFFNYHKNLAKEAFVIYNDMADAYFIHDYHMEQAEKYEKEILKQL